MLVTSWLLALLACSDRPGVTSMKWLAATGLTSSSCDRKCPVLGALPSALVAGCVSALRCRALLKPVVRRLGTAA